MIILFMELWSSKVSMLILIEYTINVQMVPNLMLIELSVYRFSCLADIINTILI